MNPFEPKQFWRYVRTFGQSLHNGVTKAAEVAVRVARTSPFGAAAWESDQKRQEAQDAKIGGLKDHLEHELWPHLNRLGQVVEEEFSPERFSNPKTNLLPNSGFRLWNPGVTLPLGWAATGSPTITRVTARTGAFGGNFACRIASGGSAGSIARTVKVKGGAFHALAGWLYLGASATVAISLTTNGASPVTVTLNLTSALIGAGGWFQFPRYGYDVLGVETPADATTVTVKLEAGANLTADFSDFQLIQGPRCDADMWEPAPEDIESITSMGILPTGYGSNGNVLTSDGAGVTSWAAPASSVQADAVIKTADENVANSTVLQNDDALLLAVAANESWVVTWTLKTGQFLTTTGIQVAVTVPAAASIVVMATMTDTGGATRHINVAASGTACDFTTAMFSTAVAEVRVVANVVNGANAGNMTLQWAQSTSSAQQLTVYAGSGVAGVKV